MTIEARNFLGNLYFLFECIVEYEPIFVSKDARFANITFYFYHLSRFLED